MNSMGNRRLLVLYTCLAIFLGVALFGCISYGAHDAANGNGNTLGNGGAPVTAASKLKVVATFYPLYEVAKEVGGSTVEVYSVVPVGVEPHDYEPTPGQFGQIAAAKLIVLLGLGFDSVESKITTNAGSDTVFVRASDGLRLVQADNNSDEAGALDPHVWLSPKRMEVIVNNIRAGLQTANPANAVAYGENANRYVARLKALDASYSAGLANCSKNAILTSHAAFGYLAMDYGFRQIAISGLGPDVEPSPQKVAELVDVARQTNISTVFYEELVDPKVTEAIARDVGAQTAVLSPLEGTANQSDDYFSIMYRNLDTIRKARECT